MGVGWAYGSAGRGHEEHDQGEGGDHRDGLEPGALPHHEEDADGDFAADRHHYRDDRAEDHDADPTDDEQHQVVEDVVEHARTSRWLSPCLRR